jgi:transcription antitermination factor NusG
MQDSNSTSNTSVSAAELQWYALRTRSRHERVVIQQLSAQGFETFLPTITETHRWSDRKKQVEVPLFSGYTFVRFAYSHEERVRVLRAHGTVGLVGMQGVGVAIPDSQIDDIRKLLLNKVPLRKHGFLRIGQRVRIRGGALDGVEGILTAENGDRSLVISVDPIQRSLSIRVEGYEVEPV